MSKQQATYKFMHGVISPEPYIHLYDLLHEEISVNQLQEKFKLSPDDYTGASCHNFFKVSKPIELTAVGFCGPWKRESEDDYALYKVRVIVWRGMVPKMVKLTEREYSYLRVNGRLFWVSFKGNVLLKPGCWYTLEFVLDGPKTYRMESTEKLKTIHVDGNEKVVFEFLFGSFQMPGIEFSFIHPTEMNFVMGKWAHEEFQMSQVKRRIPWWELVIYWLGDPLL